MRLKTAYWTTAAMSTPAFEFGFMDASFVHDFNECAKVLIRIADPTGSKLQKYDSDAVGDVIYVGSGQALLYADDGTCIFNGRILASERANGVLTLTCEDWMNQLKDERIHYDFREDLDGAGLRVSGAHGDLTNGTDAYKAPAYTNGANYYLIDSDMDWGVDDWNGYSLVFQNENFGSVTARVGPYDHSILSGTVTLNHWVNAWTDNGSADDFTSDAVTISAYHKYWLKLTEGSLFDSLTSVTLHLSIEAHNIDVTNGVSVWLLQDGAGTYELLRYVPLDENDTERLSISVPAALWADMVDATGEVIIKYTAQDSAGHPVINVYFSQLEVEFDNTGVSTYYTISDTLQDPDDGGATYDTLKVNVDLDVSGLGIWEEFKYCIARELYHQINGIVTGGDPLVTLSTDVESTSGLTTWHASDMTRFEILQHVAPIDNAVFWVPLGETEVQWKQTTDSTATKLYDWQVLRWIKTKYDTEYFANQAIIYGVRRGDDEVKVTTDDTDAQDDYDFIRTEVIKDSGISSDFEASQFGTALLNQRAKIPLSITAELAGFSSVRLGDYIQVTSDLLGITAGNYTVDRWEFANNVTRIRLQPRGTDGYVVFREYLDIIREQRQQILENRLSRDLEKPSSDTWVNP
jgi:hypothetical protein